MLLRNTLLGFASIILLASLAFAFGSNLANNPAAPQAFGHSGGETSINIPGIGLITLQDAVDQGIIGMNNVIVKEIDVREGRANDEYEIQKAICPTSYTPRIQVSAQYTFMVGGVNDDDIVGAWVTDNVTFWTIGSGDYDCGIRDAGGKFRRGCSASDKSAVNYISYCER